MVDTTYRMVSLTEEGNFGQTAATAELAKLVKGNLHRWDSTRLAIERTDWAEKHDKMVVSRSVIVEVESQPNEWQIGI